MILHRRGRFFDNRGLYALLLYYFASLINDALVVSHGVAGLFTARQIAIVLGILMLAVPGKAAPSPLYRRSVPWLILFYCVCLVSYSFAIMFNVANPDFLATLITTGANILWLVVVGRVLSQGLSENDKLRLPRCLVVLGLIPLLTGLYELFRGEHILSGEGLAEMHTGLIFWVRGLHLDKIGYVTALAPAIFCAFLLIPQARLWKKLILVGYFGAGVICLFYSFSVAGILGVAGGLAVLFLFYGSVRTKVVAALVVLLATAALIPAMRTEQGDTLKAWYESKFERNVDLEGNPRYVMGQVCIREFLRSPIWGVGFGGHVPLVFDKLKGWGGGGNAHSILSVAADLGILGTVPFLFFWLSLYGTVFRPLPSALRSSLNREDKILRALCEALSIFVLARLFLYYHSMADEAFVVWPALVYAVYIRGGPAVHQPFDADCLVARERQGHADTKQLEAS